MNKIVIIATLVLMSLAGFVTAQQIGYSSLMNGTQQYWNPAFTGSDQFMKTDLFFRQQWAGFGSGAPRTGFVSFQYPLQSLNMGAGAIINFDQTGPVSKKGIKVNYAYMLKGLLGEDSQLSIGLSGGFQQFAFNLNGLNYNDQNDVLLAGNETSAFFPSINAGVLYKSSTDTRGRDNVFFVGFAFNQLYTSNLLVNGEDQKRERHVHALIGTQVNIDRYSYFEPSLTVNYVKPDLVDILVGARYVMKDAFWLGAGYSSVSEASLQGGIILDEVGNRDGQLHIGVLGNFSVTDQLSNLGPGAEIFISYLFDLD